MRRKASFVAALEIEPKLAAARNALGVVALKRGDAATAEREIRAAIAEKPDVRLAHFNLALLAEERGQLHDGDRRVPERRSSCIRRPATRRGSTSARLYARSAIGRRS